MRSRVVLLFALMLAPTLGLAEVKLQSFVVTGSPTDDLFTSVGAMGAPNVQYAASVWPVTINLTYLRTLPANVYANLPDRTAVVLNRFTSEQRANGFIWTGDGADCTAFLREAFGRFKGQIGCNNATYDVDLTPSGAGLQLVRLVPSPGATQSDIAGLPPGTVIQNQSLGAPAAPPDTSIDVLVLFTSAVRAQLDPGGGATQTKLLAQTAIDQTQTILNHSTTGFGVTTSTPIATVNLVSAQEAAYVDDGNFNHDLTYLNGNKEATDLRKFWSADVVVFLVVSGGTGISGLSNQPDYLGLPPPGGSGTSGFAPFASSALQYNCALMAVQPGPGPTCTDYYVFPHELAHTFGANHDIPDSPWPNGPPYPTNPPMPVEPYAFGHYGNVAGMNGGYRTIMASIQSQTLCNSPCARVSYYSNSQVYTPGGFRTGVLDSQENSRVIAEVAPLAAQYNATLGRIWYNGFELRQW